MGRDWVKSIFLDSNVDPGSTKDVDPGTCLTWQNHVDHVCYQGISTRDDPRRTGEISC